MDVSAEGAVSSVTAALSGFVCGSMPCSSSDGDDISCSRRTHFLGFLFEGEAIMVDICCATYASLAVSRFLSNPGQNVRKTLMIEYHLVEWKNLLSDEKFLRTSKEATQVAG